jgi:hypothetical protein
LAYYTNGHWLHRIRIFNTGDERERELFITRISAVIKTVAFIEGEEVSGLLIDSIGSLDQYR